MERSHTDRGAGSRLENPCTLLARMRPTGLSGARSPLLVGESSSVLPRNNALCVSFMRAQRKSNVGEN